MIFNYNVNNFLNLYDYSTSFINYSYHNLTLVHNITKGYFGFNVIYLAL